MGWGERGYEGGGWSSIRDEIARMVFFEHNTTISYYVNNEYGIEYFKVYRLWLGQLSIGWNVMNENNIENFESV